MVHINQGCALIGSPSDGKRACVGSAALIVHV